MRQLYVEMMFLTNATQRLLCATALYLSKAATLERSSLFLVTSSSKIIFIATS